MRAWQKGWGGFVDGKLDWLNVDMGWGGFGVGLVKAPAIFKSRAAAREKYQDVRRIVVRLDDRT